MTTQTIECWNCGQKLSIRTDKLATARCGNCQQMVLGEEKPKVQYQRTAKFLGFIIIRCIQVSTSIHTAFS